jgi:hypothetical protein
MNVRASMIRVFLAVLCPALVFAAEKGSTPKPSAKEEKNKDKDQDKGKTSTEEFPPFEKLLEFNSRELFGGILTLKGDNFEVLFNADGHVKAGFEGKGIIDSKSEEMRGSNRRFMHYGDQKAGEKLLPGLAGVGLGEGQWVSRFPVAGNAWVQMGFRIPNLMNYQSSFKLYVNWNKGSGYETSFFQSISYVSGGKAKTTQMTALPEYKKQPHDWFIRRADPNKIEFGIRGGRCLVNMDGKEIVTVPKVVDKGGNVAIIFKKIAFTVDNLKISGKLDRDWCNKRIEELKNQGKLKLREEPKPPEQTGGN